VRVLILYDEPRPGARADELDGVVQAHAVAAALTSLGHDSTLRGVGLDLGALPRKNLCRQFMMLPKGQRSQLLRFPTLLTNPI
jgi:hypothetical protein